MRALFCENSILSLKDTEKPVRSPGEVLIRVTLAGICSTDLEIMRGYIPGFNGILGHEFIGVIADADDLTLIGKRATAEINCACGRCDFCKSGMQRHCPSRTVIGIVNRQGAFAEYISVPAENIFLLNDEIPDNSAIFIEPLAAALELFEQVAVSDAHTVLLIGDGRLAQMIANVFSRKEIPLTVLGKHPEKLQFLKRLGVQTLMGIDPMSSRFDLVIEASGSQQSFQTALSLVKPRGTIVLKSTYADSFSFNPSSMVVNEITLIGSRCGRFDDAIRFLINHKPDFSYMISRRVPFSKALQAFDMIKDRTVLKVILEMR